ncbi:MAG TPA: ATP-binding protein [Stellaceae bacterium]|nr:ATP-binding protein [Stellaceae bacterium]
MLINYNQQFWQPLAELLFGAAALAFLTWICFWLRLDTATTVPLYTIVVVLLSLRGRVLPAVTLSVIAAGCLDYFFSPPIFSFQISSPEDIVTVTVFVTSSLLITGLVRRARRLGEAAALKDRLQVIIDTIPAVVWSNSPDGSANFLNKRFRDYAGISLEEGRGWAWMNALHPEDRAMHDWQAELAAGEQFEKEARMRRADGEYRRFLLRFVPLRDEGGNIVEWYATSTDIEDLKRTVEELRRREARLRDAQLELAHANRVTATGQLAASIAHEVSQPIAAALTNANAARRWLAAEPPDLEEVRQALGRIIRDGRRASDIIGRIRALVRKAPPREDQLDINETMLEVVALTRSELRSNRTALQTKLPLVLADRIQLQQVMLNLILNAVEAMSGSSEGARELLIRTEQDGSGSVLVVVQDSGPGLKPESLDRLFDAFYTTKPGGMGMGLSICRSIIEAHGGRVWATPNLPQGAVLQFTLPQQGEIAS